ncbi:DNA polymerase III subunit gamma and tau [Brevibacterium litoralis]|uniref:DNA polymerase III subunit gamma and tau n=1 Tax=Brevibacterium litoralis TaxID=3138935 RepID=UPI0032F01A51
MSTALYRRYRPETFDEVIGQDHVTGPLKAAIANGRINHAYLFSGPRGCGKTTSARILARCLNCAEGPTPTPCGQCPSCRDLANGGPGSLDVVEIDAASHNGVDDARDLRERAVYAPARDRFKVFILDEAHMVTPQGFNALLKLVEEPPPHVKFVFATTEPEKVIGTIRSRTHHYPFRLVPPEVLTGYMEDLCARESVPVGKGVLPLVVRAGGGSVRDSLSVLDQLMAGATAEGLDYLTATALLGYTPESLLGDIVDAFAAGDGAGVFRVVDRVVESGQDPRRFVEDLLERFRDLVVVGTAPDAAHGFLPEVPADRLERLKQQALTYGAAELSRAADLLNAGLTQMTGATSPRLQLELICARILLPAAEGTRSSVLTRVERLERRLGMGPTGTLPAGAVPAAPPTTPAAEAPSPSHGPVPGAAGASTSTGAGASDGQAAGAAPTPSEARARAYDDDLDALAAATAAAESFLADDDGRQDGDDARQDDSDARQVGPAPEAPQTPAAPETVDRQDQAGRQDQGPAVSERRPAGGPGPEDPTPTTSAPPQVTPPESPAPSGPAPSGPAPSVQESGGPTPAPADPGRPVGGPDAPARPEGSEIDAIRRAWPDILTAVGRRSQIVRAVVAANSVPLGFRGGELGLAFDNRGAAEQFGKSGGKDKLAAAIDETLGIRLTVVYAGSGPQFVPWGEGPGSSGPEAPGGNGGYPGVSPSGRPGGTQNASHRPSQEEIDRVVGPREADRAPVDHSRHWQAPPQDGPWSGADRPASGPDGDEDDQEVSPGAEPSDTTGVSAPAPAETAPAMSPSAPPETTAVPSTSTTPEPAPEPETRGFDEARPYEETSAGEGAVDLGAVVVPPPVDIDDPYADVPYTDDEDDHEGAPAPSGAPSAGGVDVEGASAAGSGTEAGTGDDLDFLGAYADEDSFTVDGVDPLTAAPGNDTGRPGGRTGGRPGSTSAGAPAGLDPDNKFARLAARHNGQAPPPPVPEPQAPPEEPDPVAADYDIDPEADVDISAAPEFGVPVVERVLGGVVIEERDA